MKVFRAVGKQYDPGEDRSFSEAVSKSHALFVTSSEDQAIAWALALWHRAPKSSIQELEVSCIRSRKTLEVMDTFESAGQLCEFIPSKDGGFDTVYHEFFLEEAVILQEDII